MGQDDFAASLCGDVNGLEFAEHASGADVGAGFPGHGADFVGDFVDEGDDRIAVSGAWAAAVEAGNVGEDDEQFGVHFRGDQCGKAVVVAKGEVDFVDGDAVVFVDDGYDAHGEKGVHGVAEVEVRAAVGENVVSEQDLGDFLVEYAKGLLVLVHEDALSNGGAGLSCFYVSDFSRDTQRAGSHADGARGDKDNLSPLCDELCYLAGDDAEKVGVDAAVEA